MRPTTRPIPPQMDESRPLIHGPLRTNRLGRALVLDVTAPQVNMVVSRGSSLARSSVLVTSFAREYDLHSTCGKGRHEVQRNARGVRQRLVLVPNQPR